MVVLIGGCATCIADKENFEAELIANLKLGDSKEKIILFIKKMKWDWGYSPITGFTISDPSEGCEKGGTQIKIFVDSEERFLSYEIKQFTDVEVWLP